MHITCASVRASIAGRFIRLTACACNAYRLRMAKRAVQAVQTEPEAFDRRLHVMVSETLHTKLVALAAAHGVSPSAMLRILISNAA